MDIPNPGSEEAQKHDCTCPVLDNNYGKGVGTPPQFWTNNECPLHGWDTNKPYKLKTKEKLDGTTKRKPRNN